MTGSVGQGAAAGLTAAATTVAKAAGTTGAAGAAAGSAGKAAKTTVDAAAAVAPAIIATKGGLTGTGWFGLTAGSAGIIITLLDAWKDASGSGRGITAGDLLNSTTGAIAGGAVLLTIGEKTGATSLVMRNFMRSAGVGLVLGGLAGAIVGAVNTFGDDFKGDDVLRTSQSQTPTRFGTTLPPSPANLAGVQVASADVIGEGRSLERVPVYVDPSTARELPEGTKLGTAIGEARAAAQADDDYRSHAVIQTSDGHYWTVRLKGGLDQVDGPEYTDGTKFDVRYDPQIGRRQQALQAIAGVEGHYAFPENMEPTAPVQYTGDIPWVTPTLPGSKPSTTASPNPTTTPSPSSTPSPTTSASPSSTPNPSPSSTASETPSPTAITTTTASED